ncbi:ATP-binding protein [Actibacterium sp. 188UL27-1]|uniref:ATP-binding protein n=1 Tax=Actibacterium sp. 188UL27-1 TaxID=2786961 RepID=UPI00195A68E1|nr:ATP-binding protein [Actibacterium sp. 188UL27-1]MBM7068422.1 response regulator [Actibacterium sp. 188UL27-1]
MRYLRNRLGRRIVGLMVLASALLSILAACFQLYNSYQRDLARVMDEFSIIDNSFRSGLENALWQFNFAQVDVLIDGIFAQADVINVDLQAATGQRFERGSEAQQRTLDQVFTLVYRGEGGRLSEVGQLTVGVSLAKIRGRLWAQAIALVASNFVKTFAASLIMLAIFDRMVSRHLRSLSEQLGGPNWLAGPDAISLPRSRQSEGDELDLIVAALNDSGRRAWHAKQIAASASHRFETVLNVATSGIVALDETGMVLFVNPRARHMLGGVSDITPFPWPEEINFLDAESLTPLEASANPLNRSLCGNNLRNETHLLNRILPGVNRRYIRVDSVRLEDDPDGIATVMMIDDVSEQERNRQVIDRKSRLDALGQLTGGIAHDFNNLLASILYAINLAQKANNPVRRDELLDVAMKSVDRGRDLTSRLLAFAKRQPGMANSRPVQEVFQDFERLVSPMLEAQISIKTQTEDDKLQIYCDHAQLETALMNLVLNSRDAIIRAGKGNVITLHARPVLSVNKELDNRQVGVGGDGLSYRYVELSLVDNGPGMDKETLARATDPFFTTKDSSSGTGLGLSMVYGFVQQADGDLRIYSEPGLGTTVQLTLPRGTFAGPREEAMPQSDPVLGHGQVVLVVEDETDLLIMLESAIGDLGYGVLVATSGQAALDLVNGGAHFDLLLTDVVMPGKIGGFELARLVRAKLPDMPVIYSSGYVGFTADEMGAVQAPLLHKPATLGELADAISDALAGATSDADAMS